MKDIAKATMKQILYKFMINLFSYNNDEYNLFLAQYSSLPN